MCGSHLRGSAVCKTSDTCCCFRGYSRISSCHTMISCLTAEVVIASSSAPIHVNSFQIQQHSCQYQRQCPVVGHCCCVRCTDVAFAMSDHHTGPDKSSCFKVVRSVRFSSTLLIPVRQWTKYGGELLMLQI